jgi:predicted nuclease of restriction endonuclease-like (RecB) superfamily
MYSGMNKIISSGNNSLFEEIKQIVEQARIRIAVAINVEITSVYWKIGQRIRIELLHEQRAEYGKQVIKQLASELTLIYGQGWGEKQLRHCLRFAETFPDEKIISALWRQLSWSHIKTIMYLDDELKRMFYLEMCKVERWSTRILQERINSMLYERTAISKKPDETIKRELQQLKNSQKVTPDLVFRDPYFLDFLGLHNDYSEKDLESAIVTELQRFIIEMGSDFAFLARQKRITIDKRDYKIDLLFYHRKLKCLVAIDLKLGEFEAGYKGQMELYLNWLARYETVEGENSPIGLILCSGKNEEHVDLMQLDKSNIRVAEYLTILPPKELLLDKLHKAIAIARQRLEGKE